LGWGWGHFRSAKWLPVGPLQDGIPNDEVSAALTAKEHLRAVYAADDVKAARKALRTFYTYCADAEVAEITRLAKTVAAWEAEILGYHRTQMASNGPTEAVNLLVETVRRTGFGFRNFDNYRLRLLLSCGIKWHTPVPARIRGHKPRLIA
jgi:transposase